MCLTLRVPIVPMSHQYVVTEAMLPAGRDPLPTLRDPDLLVYFREDWVRIIGAFFRTLRTRRRHCYRWSGKRRQHDLARRYPLSFISPPARNFLNSSFANLPRFVNEEKTPKLDIHPDDAAARGLGVDPFGVLP